MPKNFHSKASTSGGVAASKTKINSIGTKIARPRTAENQAEKTENIAIKVNGIHTVTARAAVKVAAQNHNIGEQNLGIVDGYLENDPEVTTLTLQHAQTIMAISRYKLIQYLAMLRTNLPRDVNETVLQSLDGMEEICSLLKNSYSSSLYPNTVSVPVEPALEADEYRQQSQKKLSTPTAKQLSLDLDSRQMTGGGGPPPSLSREALTPSPKQSSSLHKKTETYEIPDNSRIAERLFGNVRDIPMRTFKSGEPLDELAQNLPSPDPTK